MKLSDWLETQKKTQAAFGAAIGLTQGRVSQIARAGTDDLRTALRIEEATAGAVTLNDLLRAPKASSEAVA